VVVSHVIRLRGPWQYELRFAEGRTTGVLQMPCNLAAVAAAGAELSLSRRFHRPTGLDTNTKVWLAIGPANSVRSIALNSNLLPIRQNDDIREDVTARLAAENIVTLDLNSQAAFSGDPLDVWLEIESGPEERIESKQEKAELRK
jgi:hypothetical protein